MGIRVSSEVGDAPPEGEAAGGADILIHRSIDASIARHLSYKPGQFSSPDEYHERRSGVRS